MATRVDGPSGVVVTGAVSNEPAKPAAKASGAEPLVAPEPQSAVFAISNVPLPPVGAEVASPAGVEALLALEDRLGEPDGGPVADAFAHTWVKDLAAR